MYKLEKQYRLKRYDYSSGGLYLVTICTWKRKLLFGKVEKDEVILSKVGEIVKKFWLEIPDHFEYVRLDEFVVMPNHLHGIVIIDKTRRNGIYSVPTDSHVPTRYSVPTDLLPNDPFDEGKMIKINTKGLQPQPNSLSIVIRVFKAAVTRYARSNFNIKNVWQSRFHDRIIRSDNELENLREYILNNPLAWETDRNYKKDRVSIKKSKSVKLEEFMKGKNSSQTISLFDQSLEQPVEPQILSVSEFNHLIKDVLKNLGIFQIKGEITELKITKNKGVNITLSDGKANLRIGGYAPSIKGIDLIEKDMDVIVTGTCDIYVPYGSFSLNALVIEPKGEGSLAIAYQKLKEKLEGEGLFAEEHKQELPKFITKVALLTGEDSAAYSDFIKILKENKVSVDVIYYPVLVQGRKSVKSISSAMMDARNSDVDLIVLTRGGGSLEDLKSFNDEDLVQLVFSSPRPVIAGVGHEKDESLCDFVADIRASTPSQAAYYIAERNKEFIESVVLLGENIDAEVHEKIRDKEHEMESLIVSFEEGINKLVLKFKNSIESLERILTSYNVKNVLKRGFAILSKKGRRLSSIKNVKIRENIEAILKDGSLTAKVNKINSTE